MPHHGCHTAGHRAVTVNPQLALVTGVLELMRALWQCEENKYREEEKRRKRWRLTGEPISNGRSAAEKFYRSSPIYKRLAFHVSCTCARAYIRTCAHTDKSTHTHFGGWRERVIWHEEIKPQANRGHKSTQTCVRDMRRLFDKQKTRWCFINQQNVLRPAESHNGKEVATKLSSNFTVSQ